MHLWEKSSSNRLLSLLSPCISQACTVSSLSPLLYINRASPIASASEAGCGPALRAGVIGDIQCRLTCDPLLPQATSTTLEDNLLPLL